MRILYLHIGAPKTGTTAIQSFLTRNRRLLKDAFDISIPKALSHRRAAAMYAYATQRVSQRKREKLGVDSPEELNRRYEARIAALADSITTTAAVCSNELLFGLNRAAIDRLKGVLSPVFSSFQVILYIRRQDLLETAAYLQAYKGGYDQLSAFNSVLKRRRPGYLAVVKAWSEIFGSRKVRTFLYDDVMCEEGDIIGHFMCALGVADLSSFAQLPATRTNATWGFHQACASRTLRASCKDESSQRIRAFVETLEPGPRHPVGRAEALAFYRSFARENEKIRKRYFPHKTSLFEEDFSMYPETFDMAAAERAHPANQLIEQYKASQVVTQSKSTRHWYCRAATFLARLFPAAARKLWRRRLRSVRAR